MKAKLALLLSFLILSAGISVVIAQENIFTVRQPDYQKSPYTGMTRRHWIQAGEYLLKGAFDYIHWTTRCISRNSWKRHIREMKSRFR